MQKKKFWKKLNHFPHLDDPNPYQTYMQIWFDNIELSSLLYPKYKVSFNLFEQPQLICHSSEAVTLAWTNLLSKQMEPRTSKS